jgi:hypothetical protein
MEVTIMIISTLVVNWGNVISISVASITALSGLYFSYKNIQMNYKKEKPYLLTVVNNPNTKTYYVNFNEESIVPKVTTKIETPDISIKNAGNGIAKNVIVKLENIKNAMYGNPNNSFYMEAIQIEYKTFKYFILEPKKDEKIGQLLSESFYNICKSLHNRYKNDLNNGKDIEFIFSFDFSYDTTYKKSREHHTQQIIVNFNVEDSVTVSYKISSI